MKVMISYDNNIFFMAQSSLTRPWKKSVMVYGVLYWQHKYWLYIFIKAQCLQSYIHKYIRVLCKSPLTRMIFIFNILVSLKLKLELPTIKHVWLSKTVEYTLLPYPLFGILLVLVRYRRLPEQKYLFSITSIIIFLNVAVEQLFINYNTALIIHSHYLNFKNW